jgi:hypothetical protein
MFRNVSPLFFDLEFQQFNLAVTFVRVVKYVTVKFLLHH